MRVPVLVLPAAALLVGGGPAPTDQARIRGVWNMTAMERGGKAEPGDKDDPLQLEFDADTFWFHLPGGAGHPQPYRLDPKATPKAIDWPPGGKRGPARLVRGIYELKGDTLRICWGKEGGDRPAAFTTKGAAGEWLWELARERKK